MLCSVVTVAGICNSVNESSVVVLSICDVHSCFFDCRWTVLTCKIIWHCSFHDSYVGLYDEVRLFLNIFQTAALLEVTVFWFHH